MRKRERITAVLLGISLALTGCGGTVTTEGTTAADPGQNIQTVEKNRKEAVYIGDVSIEEYRIVGKNKECRDAGTELQTYIKRTVGVELPVESHAGFSGKTIRLVIDGKLGKDKCIQIADGEITLSAKDAALLYDCVYLFVDTYLGWIKAGTEEAHISNRNATLHIPADVAEQEAWIEEREPIVTLWNVNWSRGAYMDNAVSVKNNLMYYTEDQLYEYVKMMKYCGFTGIQVTDMCSAWAGLGSWQAVHEKLRMMADAAHSLDMKFTLWVWGAEFSDCGWVDNSVSYDMNGGYAYENEEVRETFEKYYDIYADLADCCDRVIGHYYDPGNLRCAEDIAYFAKMLRDKFWAVNPDIDFGISCWVDEYDKNVFVDVLGTDITLYERGYRDDPEGEYNKFRGEINNLGCRMGTWAWNTCEMEIDQLAQMNFNMDHLRSVYLTARNYDSVKKPDYWSEMDSYHVLNVFSLYCAGQMLINPDIDTAVLFRQLSVSAVGEEYADSFSEILDIIQDARTGSSYDTYFWSRENYILKSDAYPAEEILARCDASIPILQEMIDRNLESNTLPLPISLKDVLRLMMPQLQQIRSFAEFRIGLAELEEAYSQGEAAETIAERLQILSEPIKSYNTVVGAWGQIEARAQYEMVTDFCNRTSIEIQEDPTFRASRKLHIYMQLVSYQLGRQEPYYLADPYYQLGLAYGQETYELVDELVEEGLFIRQEDGRVYLADWDNYIYNFSE